MTETASQAPFEQSNRREALMNTLSNFLDQTMEKAGLLVAAAGEALRALVPNAVPWPQLPALKPALALVSQYRQQHGADPSQPNLAIPRHFPFIDFKQGRVRRGQRVPQAFRLSLDPQS